MNGVYNGPYYLMALISDTWLWFARLCYLLPITLLRSQAIIL